MVKRAPPRACRLFARRKRSFPDRVEEHLAEVESDAKSIQDELKEVLDMQKIWKNSSLEELTKMFSKQLAQSGLSKMDERIRSRQLLGIDQNIAIMNALLSQAKEERDESLKDKALINVDVATEQRRMTDIKAEKLTRMLVSCDLVIIPARMTIRA